ncbi:hypothetical protein N7326_07705 [Corynebacterium sp. ES2794-CONJ1]|uniref:hypothetical protein n=1 Tax=unclassified Corynebacterium TaxID=2624378 RepID=UPI00216AE6CE|nr:MULTISPECIES: hypothetical protein [unclassified Corynebacterium]MCS4532288.1 hypothetical protein [Corynebacterium sp. ES2730-CONJ]MCU9519747.1 hypothetical protein [Corynebacterium sp. ES2794-CONJ1]
MKNKALIALTLSASMLLPAHIAQAAVAPTTNVEMNAETSEFVAMSATFDPSLGRTEGIAALKELRSKMWDLNPIYRHYYLDKFPEGTRLQDVARHYGITSKAQYTNVKSDENLTWIAVQRAGEAGYKFAHTRIDGSSYRTATRDGHKPQLESLALGQPTLRETILKAWGEKELDALKKTGGTFSGDSGHLMHMLNPEHSTYGFARVHVHGLKNKISPSYAAISSSPATKPDRIPAGERTEWIYRTKEKGESATGIIGGSTPKETPAPKPQNPPRPSKKPEVPGNNNTQPDKKPDNDPNSGSAADFGGENNTVGIIVGVIVAVIGLIGALAKFAMDFRL